MNAEPSQRQAPRRGFLGCNAIRAYQDIEDTDAWQYSGKGQIVLAMAGELIPQIVLEAAERRGSVDEIVTRWIALEYQPQPTDIQKLSTDHFASVAGCWRHKTRHPHAHAGAMVILNEWAQRLIVTA